MKILDDNIIAREFPGMEGMEVTYHRCQIWRTLDRIAMNLDLDQERLRRIRVDGVGQHD
jgi:hypothetical protein